MPKLSSKTKVLGGRAQVISYERDPSVFFYRELITGTKSYRSKRLDATTLEAATLEAVDAYTALRLPGEVATPSNPPHSHTKQKTGKLLKNAIQEYLKELMGKVTAGVIKQGTYDIAEDVVYKPVLTYFEVKGLVTTADINFDTFKNYVVWRQQTVTGPHNNLKKGTGLTKLSLLRELTQIRKWVNVYLIPRGYIKAELANRKGFIDYPKINHEDLLANPAINPDDWLVILNYVRNEWINQKFDRYLPKGYWTRTMFWNWILICKNTGARPEELMKLKWKDVEFEDVGRTDSSGEEVSKEISHVVLKSSKTGQIRISSCNCVYVFERWLQFQKEWIKEQGLTTEIGPNDFVWGKPHDGNRTLSYSSYKRHWQEIRNKLKSKLKGHIFSDESYTLYSLRSTFIEDNLIQGKDIFLIAKAAGHDVKTLMKHYERIDPRKRSREMTEFQYGSTPKTVRRSSLQGVCKDPQQGLSII
jgi:integrase